MHIAGDSAVYNHGSRGNFPEATSEQSVALSWPSFEIQWRLWHLCFTFSISLDAEKMAKDGYQNLIRFLKDGRKGWVKQRVVYPQSINGCPKKVSAFDQQQNKSLLFNFENFSHFR